MTAVLGRGCGGVLGADHPRIARLCEARRLRGGAVRGGAVGVGAGPRFAATSRASGGSEGCAGGGGGVSAVEGASPNGFCGGRVGLAGELKSVTGLSGARSAPCSGLCAREYTVLRSLTKVGVL